VVSAKEIECPLPPSPLSNTSDSAVYTWNISVSNDGQSYSNPLQLTVYDSRCHDCDCSGQCEMKVSILYAILHPCCFNIWTILLHHFGPFSCNFRKWFSVRSGARCRVFAYGPADATAIPKPHHLLPFVNPDYFYVFGTGLSRLSWKRLVVVV